MALRKNDDIGRVSYITTKANQLKLGAIARQHRITQSDVLDVLIENADSATLAPQFAARCDKKGLTARKAKTAAAELLKHLSPAERATFIEQLELAATKSKETIEPDVSRSTTETMGNYEDKGSW